MTKDNLKDEPANSTNTVLGAVNISGRTQKQQESVEAKLLKQGSLWGRFEILHKYVFTRKEFNQVRKAQEIILRHKEKRMKLVNT